MGPVRQRSGSDALTDGSTDEKSGSGTRPLPLSVASIVGLTVAFPDSLSDPANDPFFSVENAASWMTSFGYQLFLEQDDSATSATLWSPEDASAKRLKAYRSYIISKEYLDHPFFSLENLDAWINPVAFQAYMTSTEGSGDNYRGRQADSTPFSSRAPSRAASSVSHAGSRASSRVSFIPSSRASSPISFADSDFPSHPPSSMSVDNDFVEVRIPEVDEAGPSLPGSDPIPFPAMVQLGSPPSPTLSVVSIPDPPKSGLKKGGGKAKGKRKAINSDQIQITRQLYVNEIVKYLAVQSTWDVPRTATAYHLDFSASASLLKTSDGKDQESWGGSAGHAKGDVMVFGLASDPEKQVLCRRCDLKCNGVDTCEFIDPDLFADCDRFEVDKTAMQELWNHELNANEREAASASGIISRFYARIQNSKCKIECTGVPILVRRSKGPSAHGKHFFIGCSKWSPAQRDEHIFWPMPPNVNETTLRFVMENGGLLPTGPENLNEKCVLTVHPRIGLKNCPYSHVIDGRIKLAKIQRRKCPTRMIIFVPVKDASDLRHQALLILSQAHNHPAHPTTKPSSQDRLKLETAVNAAGLTGLTVQKLLHAASTSIVYDGARVAENSPAFADSRRLRDFISVQKKKEYPRGMGWEGVLYELREREVKLPKEERYIHTAMDKGGFRLVVTMHPYIARFIHAILSLNIDYTFKRVEGTMDEWEVAGFLDRFKHRRGLTFASLYCDKQSTESFLQLFTELFDTIRRITGQTLKLAPFYPDAKCRAATAMVTEPDPRGVGPDAPVLPDDHELDSMESDYGLTADPNSNFSNELSRFEKTLFENPPPFVDYFDMEELLPDFDPLAFNFDTIHADPAMSFQVLPAPEPTSSNLPVLLMPQPSSPFVAATIEEEIPALPTRKRSRQAEVETRGILLKDHVTGLKVVVHRDNCSIETATWLTQGGSTPQDY
ncbi:hypothetical protein B0H11DRAFT_2387169 [Mycena galericulata]|nr:hypothetical protein B0H11DRAFT_2387169 [Mycena galericulata]